MKKNVGKKTTYKLGEEIDPFVKIVKIVDKESFIITYGITRDEFYFGWYNGIEPYKRDVEQYDCPKKLIPYEKDDCLTIKGFVKWKGTNNFFLNESGNRIRWTRLIKCRVIENKGKF